MKKLSGYSNIIDDGHADDHGYFIPKQTTLKKMWGNIKVNFVDVPQQELLDALEKLSIQNKIRLEQAKIML